MSTEPDGTSVQRLYRELSGVEADATQNGAGPGHRTADVVADVTAQLFPEESFRFDEKLVKHSLEELLVVLVSLRDGGTHGKGLMEDLSEVFDAHLSPGTVYPRLHDLEEADVLEVHELVRTKEYRLDDVEAARDLVETAMAQHLAVGSVLSAALDEL